MFNQNSISRLQKGKVAQELDSKDYEKPFLRFKRGIDGFGLKS